MHADESLAFEAAEVLAKSPVILGVLVRPQIFDGDRAKGTDGGQERLFRLANSILSIAQKDGFAHPIQSRRQSRVGFQSDTRSTVRGFGRTTAREVVHTG
jgi:hypothetical protein